VQSDSDERAIDWCEPDRRRTKPAPLRRLHRHPFGCLAFICGSELVRALPVLWRQPKDEFVLKFVKP